MASHFHLFGVVLARFFFPQFSIVDSKTVQRCALCRSRRELSNDYLLFTCKMWLRYSREPALSSLPALRVQIPQVSALTLAASQIAARLEGIARHFQSPAFESFRINPFTEICQILSTSNFLLSFWLKRPPEWVAS